MASEAEWQEAVDMVRLGREVSKVSQERKLEYGELADRVRQSQGTEWTSWLGARLMATSRLDMIVAETESEERKRLAGQIHQIIDHFYYLGKEHGQRIINARDVLQ